jgi:branched-chain amino acid transport system permease protein
MAKFWIVRLGSILLAIVGCFLLDSIASSSFNSISQTLILLAGLYVTLAVSLNLINGVTGQFSIGHFAFYQIGAYTAGALSKAFFAQQPLAAPMWIVVTMLCGAAVASLAGFLVGLPSLRLKGDYLAIVTLGFGEIIRIASQNIPYVGRASGMVVEPKIQPIWLVWLLAILTIAVSRNLLKTAQGLRFLAVREDEVASAAMGVNVTGTKVTAFVLGSAFAGAAGALYAHQSGFILPTMFKMENSFIVLTMVVLGGTGSITGSALAAVTLFLIPEYLRDLKAVPISLIIAMVLSLVGTISLVRYQVGNYHGPVKTRTLRILGIIAGGFVSVFVLSPLFGLVPQLSKGSVEGSQLRIPIFAITLIVLMLLRPQGIFAHHEFSWDWVKSLFNRKKVATV